VEAPGIEPGERQTPDAVEPQSGSIGVHADPADVPDRASKCPIDRGDVTESSGTYELSDVVETALAKALVLAAEAKRWDVVIHIAEELRRRRHVQLFSQATLHQPPAVQALSARVKRGR
jgi:hypothetical protein